MDYRFSQERAKFEGWLKVESCDSLSKHFKNVCPERDRTDTTFESWAIELKTVNTNIRYDGVKNRIRPITKNTQRVIVDIQKLKRTRYLNKSVLFAAFPIHHNNENWQIQLKRISSRLAKISYVEFDFKERIPGVLYFGLV
jgi:hypothetical protein